MKRDGVVCFFVKNNQILLALIEYPDGKLLWNGLGGYVEQNENLNEAVVREVAEETDITINQNDLVKMAEVDVNKELSLHVFITEKWSGENIIKDKTIKELRWFSKENIPFDNMHKDNNKWLLYVLNCKKIRYQGKIVEVDNFV